MSSPKKTTPKKTVKEDPTRQKRCGEELHRPPPSRRALFADTSGDADSPLEAEGAAASDPSSALMQDMTQESIPQESVQMETDIPSMLSPAVRRYRRRTVERKTENVSEDRASAAPPASPAIRRVRRVKHTDTLATPVDPSSALIQEDTAKAITPSTSSVFVQKEVSGVQRSAKVPVLWSPTKVKGATTKLLTKPPTASAPLFAVKKQDTTVPESVQKADDRPGSSGHKGSNIPVLGSSTKDVARGDLAKSPTASSSPDVMQHEVTNPMTVPVSVQKAEIRPVSEVQRSSKIPVLWSPTKVKGATKKFLTKAHTASAPLFAVKKQDTTVPESVKIADDRPVSSGQKGSKVPELGMPTKGAAGGLIATASTAPPPYVRLPETEDTSSPLTFTESDQTQIVSEDTSSLAPPSPAVVRWKKRDPKGRLAKTLTASSSSSADITETTTPLTVPESVQMPIVPEDIYSATSTSEIVTGLKKVILSEKTPTATTPPTKATTPLTSPETVQMDISPVPPPSPAVMRRYSRIRRYRKIVPKMGPLQKISHHVARGNYKSLPNDIMAVPSLRDLLIKEVMKHLKQECEAITRVAFGSILRKTSLQSLNNFHWEDLVEEWKSSAPTLLKVIECVTSITMNEPTPSDTTEGKTKKRIATMAGAMMLHARSRRMCAPMFRNSLLLRHAGATKRSFQRFRAQGMCVSYKQTLNKLKDMAASYDKELLQWKQTCEGTDVEHGGIDERPDDDDEWMDIDEQSEHSDRPAEDGNVEEPTTSTAEPEGPTPLPEPTTSTSDIQASPPPTQLPFQLTMDNLDRSVRPHTLTMAHQRLDYHWLLMLANRERVSAAHLSDETHRSVLDVPFEELIPSDLDNNYLLTEFQELVGRVVVSLFPTFAKFKDNVNWHLPHQYSQTMSQKTKIIPLGLLDVDEKKSEDMISTIQHINDRYVPYIPGEMYGQNVMKPIRVTVSGDQLTKQNSDKAINSINNSNSKKARQDGIIPAVADFHCSMNFNDVIFKNFYDTSSATDIGTLYHLKNKINRKNVNKSALGDHYRPNDTFIHDVTDALLLTATLDHFGMESKDDSPTKNNPPSDFLTVADEKEWFNNEMSKIVSSYIMKESITVYSASEASTELEESFKCRFDDCSHPPFKTLEHLTQHEVKVHDFTCTDHGRPSATEPQRSVSMTDGVFNYHSAFLKMALLERDFQDAIKEGDGERICRLWKFKMLYFKQADRRRYSLEALKLQFDLQALLSPSEAHRLKWNRTVNPSGQAGNNMSMDLNCEHHVLYTKKCISRIGANVQFPIAQTMSRTLGEMKDFVEGFDQGCEIRPESGKHASANKEADITVMAEILHNHKVFGFTAGRSYSGYKNQKANPVRDLKQADVKRWVNEKRLMAHKGTLVAFIDQFLSAVY